MTVGFDILYIFIDYYLERIYFNIGYLNKTSARSQNYIVTGKTTVFYKNLN